MRRNILLIIACILGLSMFAQTNPLGWKPFIEQGKTWSYKYTSECMLTGYDSYDRTHAKGELSLVIDGTKEIDGKEFAAVYCYYNQETEPAQNKPVFYMRESQEYGTVLYRSNTEFNYYPLPWSGIFGEDFNQIDVEFPAFSLSDPFYDGYFIFDQWEKRLYNFSINEHHYTGPSGIVLDGLKCCWDGLEMIFLESIGPIGHHGIMVYGIFSEEPDFAEYMWGGACEARFDLYSVTDKWGNVLYYDENVKPLDSVESINADEKSLNVDYFDLQGRRVERPERGIIIERKGREAKVVTK